MGIIVKIRQVAIVNQLEDIHTSIRDDRLKAKGSLILKIKKKIFTYLSIQFS